MRSLLIAVAVTSMFGACKSNTKTDKDLVGASAAAVIDSSESRPLPNGTKRVKVVETHSADGSSTITTTTDVNTKSGTKAVSKPAGTITEPVAAPAPVTA